MRNCERAVQMGWTGECVREPRDHLTAKSLRGEQETHQGTIVWYSLQNDLSISSLCYNIIHYHLYISLYIFITCCAFDIANHSNVTEDLPLQWSTERLRGSAWFSCWNKKLWNRPLQKEFHHLGQHWNSRYSGHRPPCLPMPRMPRRCQKVGCQQISSLTFFPCQFHSIYSSSVLH